MANIIKHAIASGFVLILCIVFFLESLNYPDTAARLPQLLIIIIALLSILMFVQTYFRERRNNKEEKDEIEKVTGKINVKRVVIFVTIIAAYIFLIETMGYFIITPVFIFISLIYLKATNVFVSIVLSIGFTAFVFGLFNMFLNIPIPMGILA